MAVTKVSWVGRIENGGYLWEVWGLQRQRGWLGTWRERKIWFGSYERWIAMTYWMRPKKLYPVVMGLSWGSFGDAYNRCLQGMTSEPMADAGHRNILYAALAPSMVGLQVTISPGDGIQRSVHRMDVENPFLRFQRLHRCPGSPKGTLRFEKGTHETGDRWRGLDLVCFFFFHDRLRPFKVIVDPLIAPDRGWLNCRSDRGGDSLPGPSLWYYSGICFLCHSRRNLTRSIQTHERRDLLKEPDDGGLRDPRKRPALLAIL